MFFFKGTAFVSFNFLLSSNQRKLFLTKKCGAYAWKNKFSFDSNDFFLVSQYKALNQFYRNFLIRQSANTLKNYYCLSFGELRPWAPLRFQNIFGCICKTKQKNSRGREGRRKREGAFFHGLFFSRPFLPDTIRLTSRMSQFTLPPNSISRVDRGKLSHCSIEKRIYYRAARVTY